jgi:hypothetical protein
LADLRLQINLWIPITVIQYNDVSSGKINTETSRTCREKKRKRLGTFLVELVNLFITPLSFSVPIDSAVVVTNETKVILEDIEDASHLAENKDTRTLGLELG